MLEHTKKLPTDQHEVCLNVICSLSILEEIEAVLESKGCTIKKEQYKKNKKEWYSIEEIFPDHHAGDSLQGLRYRENISQRQLAELTGVSVQNISAMEHGRRPIGKDIAKRFAKVLNTDWRMLLS